MSSYTIPGENGSLAPGTRHINFAWYFWPTVPLSSILTDTTGHQHRSTIPKGQLRPEIWAAQLEHARALLPPLFVSLVTAIKHPFVSVISSIRAPRAAYFANRLFLVGDALAQVQPTTGMGTNLAAWEAGSLVDDVLCSDDGALAARAARWEKRVLQDVEMTRLRSVAFGSWYVNGWAGIGWYHARYWAVLYWQYWVAGREGKFVTV